MDQNAPVRETEINKVMAKVNMATERVTKNFGDLNARITTVLRHEPSLEGTNKAAVPEFNTKLAQDINSVACRLEELGSYIERTKGSVEL